MNEIDNETRPTDANGNPIYRVPEFNLDGLKKRIEKLNKRAAKLKMDPLVLTETGEVFEERAKAVRRDYDPDIDNGFMDWNLPKPIKYTIRLVLITLTGNCPRVNGWTMAATIQHEEGGNILRTVPGFETTLPLQYRTNGTICEHCETNRKRNDTYVLQSETNGWKQVGRQCLADFLRSADATGLAEWAEILASLADELCGFEDEGEFFGGSGGRYSYISAQAFLTQVACCIRVDGWCSRTEAKNNFAGKQATADEALMCFDSKAFAKLSAKDQAKLTPKEADTARATSAIEWAQTLPTDVNSDYLWNIRIISHREHIGYREAGLAASIISAFNRHMEQELARKYEREHPSEWFGEVGKRDIFTLTVTGFRDIASDFGSTTLVSFRDQNGNVAKWFASNVSGFELDTTYTVKGSVKAHDEYKGHKQTLLTRCVIFDAQAEADAKKALKAARKAIKGKYECTHTDGVLWNFEIPELAELGARGSYTRACPDCYNAWSERAKQEAVQAEEKELDREVSLIEAGQVAYA